MKYYLFTGVLALLQLGVRAQQLELRSSVHPNNEKVTIYQEWPQRKLIDTPRMQGGVLTYQLPQTSQAVYKIGLRRPFADVTLFAEAGNIQVDIGADAKVVVKGGVLQGAWDRFNKELEPLEARWAEIGRQYEHAKNLDEKLAAGKAMDQVAKQVQQRRLDFSVKHARDMAGAWSAANYAFAWTPASLQQLLPHFKSQPWAAATTKILQDKHRDYQAVNMTGSAAPSFNLPTASGEQVSLDSLLHTGKYVLLDVWASWCTPCRATNRKLAPMYEELKRKGITLVSVSVDDKKDAWQQAVAADKIPWTQLLAPDGMKGDFVKAYKVQFLPSTFLIDRSGKIIKQSVTEEELKNL